jgi:hypothetical protein
MEHPVTSGGSSGRWREYALVLSVATLVSLIYFYHAIRQESTFFWSWDNLAAYYPYCQRLWRSLSVGQLTLWDPGVESGRSFVGQGETGALYPPNVLLIFFLGASEQSLTLLAVFHAIAGCFFFYLFCRHLGNDFFSSILFGISFTYIVIITQHLAGWPGRSYGLIWIPLVLLCLYRCPERWMYVALGGLFLAMSLLVGALQPFFNSMLIVGVFAGFLLFRVFKSGGRGPALSFVCRVASMMLFCLGYSSIYLLSIVESYPLLYRWIGAVGHIPAATPVPYEVAANIYYLPFRGLVDVINPFLFWPLFDGQPYFGLLALAFAIIGVAVLRSEDRLLLVVAGLGLLLSLGGQTPLYLVFYTLVPLANRIREPGRFIPLFQFGMSVIAAFGLGRSLSRVGRRKKALVGILLLFAITSDIMLMSNQWGYGTIVPNALGNSDIPSNYYKSNPIIDHVARDYLTYRALNYKNALPPNIGDVYPIETTVGYSAVMNQRYFDFLELDWSPGSVVYDLLNVRYVVSPNDVSVSYFIDQQMTLLQQWGQMSLYQRPHPMPRFWVPEAVLHVATQEDSMERTRDFVSNRLNRWNLAIVERYRRLAACW